MNGTMISQGAIGHIVRLKRAVLAEHGLAPSRAGWNEQDVPASSLRAGWNEQDVPAHSLRAGWNEQDIPS
jgi:hypothetical protein